MNEKITKKPIYTVYTLTCPLDNQIKYVGMSTNVRRRLYGHSSDNSDNMDKTKWVRKLKSLGLRPILTEIKAYDIKKDALTQEKALIVELIKDGLYLYNYTEEAIELGNLPKVKDLKPIIHQIFEYSDGVKVAIEYIDRATIEAQWVQD